MHVTFTHYRVMRFQWSAPTALLIVLKSLRWVNTVSIQITHCDFKTAADKHTGVKTAWLP